MARGEVKYGRFLRRNALFARISLVYCNVNDINKHTFKFQIIIFILLFYFKNKKLMFILEPTVDRRISS